LNSSKSILAINRELLATRNTKKEKDAFDLEDEDDPVEHKLPPGAVQFLLNEKSLEALDAAVQEVETWLTEKIAAQEKLEDWDEPVLLLSDIERKNDHLQSVLKKIIRDQAKTATKTKSSPSTTATATAKPSASTEADTEGHVADDEEQTDTTAETVTSTRIDDVDAEETSQTNRKHEEL